ncbi:hypothetical protein BACCIP111899_02010 [Bacillus rhizoplanae]|uniref:Exosporium protein n=1 Tax=Bacillus rhizoplanae TaxID=2880966 RepID=A0ABM8YAP0_9BACI|nr:hypothetical protein [Bacillus rhizoplanae]CAG9612832.1 hypothetical protein BACCIP111899_02010 [Bacillus rhizoplanae]
MDCCNNFFAFPAKEFPAFGIAFSASDTPVSIGQPIPLPSNNTNPNVSTPVLLDVVSTGHGLVVKRSGIYQLSYTLTVSLDNVPAPPDGSGRESATFFLTLNGTNVSNAIPGSGTAVRTTFNDTGLAVVTSSVVLINLTENDLIQIVPTNIIDAINTVDIRAATLTVTQIA